MLPVNDAKRLHSLYMLDLPDNREEKRFDRLTRVARRCLSAPVGLISLIEKDRPALMFCSGLNEKDASQVVSFCNCVVHSEEMLVVEDASADERFNANLLVTGVPFIRFYAGCPLRLPGGDIAGTLCVVDTRPRIPDGEELTLLKDIAALVEEEFYIISLALTDALTGVLNRRGFYKKCEPWITLKKKRKQAFCIILFDLDNLKPVNDKYGHVAGDQLLQQFAGILRRSAGQGDILARLGGDEFVVLTDCSDMREIILFTEKMSNLTSLYNQNNGSSLPLSYSWGVSINTPGDTVPLSDMLIQSDRNMYDNKRAKKSVSLPET